jgi:hypothetical protein
LNRAKDEEKKKVVFGGFLVEKPKTRGRGFFLARKGRIKRNRLHLKTKPSVVGFLILEKGFYLHHSKHVETHMFPFIKVGLDMGFA